MPIPVGFLRPQGSRNMLQSQSSDTVGKRGPWNPWWTDVMSDSTEATRTVIDRYYAALTSGDREGLLSTLHPDVVWDPPVSAQIGQVTGADAVAQALGSDVVKTTFDISKSFKVEKRNAIVDGNKAVVQQRVIATAKATGNAYDNEYCWVYTTENGQIIHMEEYADTVVASKAMGWEDPS